MSLSADRRSRSLSARRYPLGWIPCPLQVAVPEATSSLQAVIRLDPSTGRRASFRLSALTWNLRKIAQLGFGQISPYHMRRGFPTRYRCLSRLAVLAPCYCPPPPFGERSGIALATFWQWHSFEYGQWSLIGAPAYVALPRYLTTTRTLECKSQAIYLQYSMLIPQMERGFPRKSVSNVHDSGQVCMFQGKNGRNFKAFTRSRNLPHAGFL